MVPKICLNILGILLPFQKKINRSSWSPEVDLFSMTEKPMKISMEFPKVPLIGGIGSI